MTQTRDLTAVFHALADTSRLRILVLVEAMELTVGELAQVLGQSQPRVSRHLRILDEAGLVRRRKEGSWTFVESADGPASPLLRQLIVNAHSVTDSEIFTADTNRLALVRAERAEAASRWFDSRAERWDRLRALHAAEEVVERAVAQALSGFPLGTLVDIGTGTARMIELLAPDADEVIGIDRSPDMLRLARVRLEEAGIEGVQLRQGDMTALPLKDACADTVVLHLVLHYAPAPALALAEAARLLRSGGRLLLVDFAAHGEDELRRVHGHQRLGFSDERIEGWCRDAGLTIEAIDRVEGDPLTINLWTARAPVAERTEEAA